MGAINLSKETVNLSKGDKINLSKHTEGFSKAMIGLGWDPVSIGFFGSLLRTVGIIMDYDLDAYVVMLKNGCFSGNLSDIIFYKNLEFRHKGKLAIEHKGDNLTGHGAAGSDKEQIVIDFDALPKSVDQLIVAVTLYQGKERGQSLGKVKNQFIRVVDTRDNFEMCNFGSKVMSEDFNAQSFIVGRFYKEDKDWQFEAIGKPTNDRSVKDVANNYR